jgi:hypothetical protein
VALQFKVKSKTGRNLSKYHTAFYDVSKNPHLIQVLTTKYALGQEEQLNNFISPAEFEKAKRFISSRV